VRRTVDEFVTCYDDWADEYDSEWICTSASLVVKHASPDPDDTVVDLGTGTGAVALALADDAATVIGRDVSEGMLDRAREKAVAQGIENVEFGKECFRESHVENADIVVSNFAMHHLGDEEKYEAIEALAELNPRKLVIGHCMFFGETDPEDPICSQKTIYPWTVGILADVLTNAGFAGTAVEKVHN
jgi:predicted TPR repeat methyltransferase